MVHGAAHPSTVGYASIVAAGGGDLFPDLQNVTDGSESPVQFHLIMTLTGRRTWLPHGVAYDFPFFFPFFRCALSSVDDRQTHGWLTPLVLRGWFGALPFRALSCPFPFLLSFSFTPTPFPLRLPPALMAHRCFVASYRFLSAISYTI